MFRFYGWLLAGALLLGLSSRADAQILISPGASYGWGGIGISSLPFGGIGVGAYPYGGAFGPAAYGRSYSSYYAPPAALGGYYGGGAGFVPSYGITTYNSGYSGYVAPNTSFSTTTYGYGGLPTYRPGSVWMGVPRPNSVWMGGRIGGFR